MSEGTSEQSTGRSREMQQSLGRELYAPVFRPDAVELWSDRLADTTQYSTKIAFTPVFGMFSAIGTVNGQNVDVASDGGPKIYLYHFNDIVITPDPATGSNHSENITITEINKFNGQVSGDRSSVGSGSVDFNSTPPHLWSEDVPRRYVELIQNSDSGLETKHHEFWTDASDLSGTVYERVFWDVWSGRTMSDALQDAMDIYGKAPPLLSTRIGVYTWDDFGNITYALTQNPPFDSQISWFNGSIAFNNSDWSPRGAAMFAVAMGVSLRVFGNWYVVSFGERFNFPSGASYGTFPPISVDQMPPGSIYGSGPIVFDPIYKRIGRAYAGYPYAPAATSMDASAGGDRASSPATADVGNDWNGDVQLRRKKVR